MKIFHIIGKIKYYGISTHLFQLLAYQKNKGYNIKVLLLDSKEFTLKQKLEDIGIKVEMKSVVFINPLSLSKEITKGRYDIIHSHLDTAQFLVRIVKLFDFKGRVYLTNQHGNWGKKGFVEKFILNGYDKIIVPSKSRKETLQKSLNIAEKYFEIINDNISEESMKDISPFKKTELALSESDIVILMIGNFNELNNQKGVIDALELLPVKYHLFFIGSGELEKETRKYAEDKKIINRVRFLGKTNKATSFLKSADIIVHYSTEDECTSTLMESLIAKKATIVSNTPRLRELLEDMVMWVENNNPKALSKIILSLKIKKNYLKIKENIANKAKKYVLERSFDRYSALYKREHSKK